MNRIINLRNLALAGLIALLLPIAAWGQSGQRVYVSSEDDDVVVVFDASDLSRIGTIETSERPRALSLSPEGDRLYAACGDGDSIDVIDTQSMEVIDTLDVGDDPEMFALGPDGSFLYASNEDDGLLTIFDLKAGKKVTSVQVGGEPEGVLVARDGEHVYVTSEVANMVHVIDTDSHEIVANVLVDNRPRRFLELPKRDELWVTNEMSGSVSIIDTQNYEVEQTLSFDPEGFRPNDVTPVGITADSDGDTAYVSLGRANHVAVVSVPDRTITDYVLVGERAWGLGLSHDESTLYVTNGLSDDMSVVDTSSLRVSRSIPVARTPHSIAVD